jgi:arsenate reductase-like glutaredoxin family protein
MESINTSAKYVTLFINHQNTLCHKAEAYVKAHNKFVHVIDVTRNRLSPMQILEIVGNCQFKLNQMFDRTSDFYRKNVGHTSNFSEDDLAQMLANNPILFRTPFVVKGNTMKFFEGWQDFNNIN